MYVRQVGACMCNRWRYVRKIATCAPDGDMWGSCAPGGGHVRQVGACAPGGGMRARLGHVRLVGAGAPGGGRCARWGHVLLGGGMCPRWGHVRQVGE